MPLNQQAYDFIKTKSPLSIKVQKKCNGETLALGDLENHIILQLLDSKTLQQLRSACVNHLHCSDEAFWTACDTLYDIGLLHKPLAPLSAQRTLAPQRSVSRRTFMTQAGAAVIASVGAQQAAAIPMKAEAEQHKKIAKEESDKSTEQGAKKKENTKVSKEQNLKEMNLKKKVMAAEQEKKTAAKQTKSTQEERQKELKEKQHEKVRAQEQTIKAKHSKEQNLKVAQESKVKTKSKKELDRKIAVVPEPSTLLLLGTGVGAALLARKSRKTPD